MWASLGNTCLGEGGQALLPQCLHTGQLGALSWWWASQDSLPGQVPLHQAWKPMMTSVIFRSRSSSRWASTVSQRKPCSGHVVHIALDLQDLDVEEESWPLTTCRPIHHGVLEKDQGPGSVLTLCAQTSPASPGAGKAGWRDARKGARGGQHGTGKESDLQRNTEPGP